jgi:hypothetical protein
MMRALIDCGAIGVRDDPNRNAGLDDLVTKGFATVRIKRIGAQWWRVYSLVRPQ